VKAPFSKFKAAMMKTSNPPVPKTKNPGGTAPHQAPGLAGIRPRRKNNPLKSMLAPQKPFGQ